MCFLLGSAIKYLNPRAAVGFQPVSLIRTWICLCGRVCVSIVTCGVSIGLWFTSPVPLPPSANRVLGIASHFSECKSGIIECGGGEDDQNTTFFLLLL